MVQISPQEGNSRIFYFIDDKSIQNQTIFMTFDTYILSDIIRYFDHIGNNVFMIRENRTIEENLQQEIRNYQYLISYNVITTHTN